MKAFRTSGRERLLTREGAPTTDSIANRRMVLPFGDYPEAAFSQPIRKRTVATFVGDFGKGYAGDSRRLGLLRAQVHE